MKLRIACLIALLGLIFPAVFPWTAAAETPHVDLVIGYASGSTLNIGNVMPGQGGDIIVTLHNTGSSDGSVTIWLSDIISREGLNPESETGNTAEPGELDQYGLLGLTATGLTTNITLPTTLGDFPQSVSDAKYLKINLLKAGDTITLVWHWLLPAETGNDVQGDTLSVNVNYTLEQLTSSEQPIATGGGTLTDDGGGTGWELPFLPKPVLATPAMKPAYTHVSPGDIVQLSLEIVNLGRYDASDVTVNYGLPGELVVTGVAPQGLATFTDHQVNASLGTIQSGKSKIITIDVKVAGEAVQGTSISTLLQKASLVISDAAQACAANQYSLNISDLAIEPVVKQYWPFIPLVKKVGEQADILVKVANICEAWRFDAIVKVNGTICYSKEIAHTNATSEKDDFAITLKINGINSQTKQVVLGEGESRYLTFALTSVKSEGFQLPGSLSSYWWIIPTGKYPVDVNGVQGQLISELWINWPLITALLAVIALISWGLSRVISRRK